MFNAIVFGDPTLCNITKENLNFIDIFLNDNTSTKMFVPPSSLPRLWSHF